MGGFQASAITGAAELLPSILFFDANNRENQLLNKIRLEEEV